MMLLVKIPDDEFNAIKNATFVEDEKTIFRQSGNDRKCAMGIFHIIDEVKNVSIPDNATNGDMIKALFANVRIDKFIHDVNIRANNSVVAQFDKSWWNSPYKEEK